MNLLTPHRRNIDSETGYVNYFIYHPDPISLNFLQNCLQRLIDIISGYHRRAWQQILNIQNYEIPYEEMKVYNLNKTDIFLVT
ncbi:hypothetical protein BpHYR1_029834 [Brachionus plicatilis]|uniref:Uncharacterized protein n=1 Tax=Brachionus plicatilis TaxID=10195 RepID=A0A3M7PZE6_BRAPC|nr:hypothetical protein BpHYR1_029834 [Brachionus plicatilis]